MVELHGTSSGNDAFSLFLNFRRSSDRIKIIEVTWIKEEVYAFVSLLFYTDISALEDTNNLPLIKS